MPCHASGVAGEVDSCVVAADIQGFRRQPPGCITPNSDLRLSWQDPPPRRVAPSSRTVLAYGWAIGGTRRY